MPRQHMQPDMVMGWARPWVGLGHTVILHAVVYIVSDCWHNVAYYSLHQCNLHTYDTEIIYFAMQRSALLTILWSLLQKQCHLHQ